MDPRAWITNDPADQDRLIRAARTGRELAELVRPGDVRRSYRIAHRARAAAIDRDAVEMFVAYGATADGLLVNPELGQVDLDVLVHLALMAIEKWDEPDDRATAYVLTLTELVPGLDVAVADGIRRALDEKRWQRSHRPGSRATQAYLALVDDVKQDRLLWLTRATGSTSLAQPAAAYHPAANSEVWQEVAGSTTGLWATLRSEHRHDEAFRHRTYAERSNNRSVITNLLEDETDDDVVVRHMPMLGMHDIVNVLRARAERGLTLPQEERARLLAHDTRMVREAAILYCGAESEKRTATKRPAHTLSAARRGYRSA